MVLLVLNLFIALSILELKLIIFTLVVLMRNILLPAPLFELCMCLAGFSSSIPLWAALLFMAASLLVLFPIIIFKSFEIFSSVDSRIISTVLVD